MSGETIGVVGVDHVQVAMPARGEARARQFYGGLLGLREVEKPPSLSGRGGCWFVGVGGIGVHVGVDERFIAAKKSHPCFIVADLAVARRLLDDADAPIVEDDSASGIARLYTADPFGNRIELVEAGDAGFTERAGGPGPEP